MKSVFEEHCADCLDGEDVCRDPNCPCHGNKAPGPPMPGVSALNEAAKSMLVGALIGATLASRQEKLEGAVAGAIIALLAMNEPARLAALRIIDTKAKP